MVFVVRTMLRQSVVKRLIVDGKACKGGCRAASDRDVMVLEGEESEDVASRAATDIGEVLELIGERTGIRPTAANNDVIGGNRIGS
jgi:hypothetical protein